MPTVRYTVIDGRVMSELRAGAKRDYVPDPLGSTVALLDNTATKTDTFSYWPFGEQVSRTGTTPTPFEYVGTLGYYSDSSSRSYVLSRYFDATVGRWQSANPDAYAGENGYIYGDGNPVNEVTPDGMHSYADTGKPGIGVGDSEYGFPSKIGIHLPNDNIGSDNIGSDNIGSDNIGSDNIGSGKIGSGSGTSLGPGKKERVSWLCVPVIVKKKVVAALCIIIYRP